MILESGWPSCTRAQCDDVTIPGTSEVLPFQHGIPAVILPAFMAALNKYVESVLNIVGYADEGSYTPTNSVWNSNHLGGVAFDYNWKDHPMGQALAGWFGSDIIDGPEEPEIRRILDYFSLTLPDGTKINLVYWGNDWTSPKDSMHFQMGYGTYENQIAVWDWINTHIQPNGESLYRADDDAVAHGGAPTPIIALSQLLGTAMGNVPGVDYDVLLPYFQDAMEKAGINNQNRTAMFCAQLGHESVGLKYMKEIGDAAYFAKYNNRSDLGNGPTDGARYPGRGPIQITGRNNYLKLSQWAFAQGYVPTATYFEDNPEQLEQLNYAFLGAVWYWTVARPDLNSLSDAGDVETATLRINGGDNGLEDRQNRYDHCQTLDLMPLVEEDWMSDPSVQQQIAEIWRETVNQKGPSRSFMATDGTVIDTPLGIDWNTDGNAWTLVLTEAYRLGVPLAISTVEYIATNGVYPNSYAGEDFNKWLADFGQAYCKGLVAEKAAKTAISTDAGVPR